MIMKKAYLYVLFTCTLLAGALQAQTIVTTYDPGQFNASSGTVDETGLALLQSFSVVMDFTGDGIDDTLSFTLSTSNDDGETDFNASGMWYLFKNDNTYTMELEDVTLTTTDSDYVSVDLEMSLKSIFVGKNYRGSVTDGTATITATTNYTNETPTDNTTGEAVTALTGTSFTWTDGGGVGTRAFDLDFIVTVTVPEPSSYALLAGLIGLGAVMLRRRRQG
jgi:hypothetical protein